MNIKRIAKEIYQVAVTLRAEARKVRRYGKNIQKIRDMKKPTDQKGQKRLAEELKENLDNLQETKKACADCMHLINKRMEMLP